VQPDPDCIAGPGCVGVSSQATGRGLPSPRAPLQSGGPIAIRFPTFSGRDQASSAGGSLRPSLYGLGRLAFQSGNECAPPCSLGLLPIPLPWRCSDQVRDQVRSPLCLCFRSSSDLQLQLWGGPSAGRKTGRTRLRHAISYLPNGIGNKAKGE